MLMWKENDKIDFDFHNAHDLNNLREGSQEETIKRKLRERLNNTKQMIVLVGDLTRFQNKFVRWEMEVALSLDIPIIAVNLNKKRCMDEDLCPAIIRDKYVVHIPFAMKIIKHALDKFPEEYAKRRPEDMGPRVYPDQVYTSLGL
jgi:hypothetical protein